MSKFKTKMAFWPVGISFILAIVFSGCAPAKPQAAGNNAIQSNGGITFPTPDPAHGKATGEIVFPNSSTQDSGADLQAKSAPDVKLIYPAKRKSDAENDSSPPADSPLEVGLPPEAKNILSNYWQYLLTVKSDTNIAEMVFTQNDAERALQKITIDAPDGRRRIAPDEAHELVKFTNDLFRGLGDRIRSEK